MPIGTFVTAAWLPPLQLHADATAVRTRIPRSTFDEHHFCVWVGPITWFLWTVCHGSNAIIGWKGCYLQVSVPQGHGKGGLTP
jgi:hypothetical protein